MKLSVKLVTLALLTLQTALLCAADWDKDKDRVQAFLGVMELKNQTGEIQGGDGEPVDIDFANMPTIGIEVETPHGEADSGLEYGINAGGGVSWRGDNTRFAGTIGGAGSVVVFRIDNSFTLAEVHLGGYLRAHLGEAADFYLGAGPTIMYGHHKAEDGETEEDDPVISNGTIVIDTDSASDITIGFYARAGIEFDLGNQSQWGLGVRYLGGELDFSDTVGKIDIEGAQLLLTYSAWY
jgi:opacity protein-like surface antigen